MHSSAFLMTLTSSFFVCHSSLLTAKGVDLVVAHDGFLLCNGNQSVFFIVITLIAKVFFKQLLIPTTV